MADIRVEKVQTISCNNLSVENYKAFDIYEAVDFSWTSYLK